MKGHPLLSSVVLTRNEERNIRRCLQSLAFADEVIVVDAESTDATRSIAEAMGAKVIVHPWQGGGPQADFAIAQATYEWTLLVDADEEVSPELATAVKKAIADERYVAYEVLRVDRVLGRWLYHGGFYPHYEIRLFRKGFVRHDPRPVHRKVHVNGPVGRLSAPLWHYTAEDFLEWLIRNLRRARIEAEWDFLQGKRFNPWAIGDAWWKFARRFFLKGGFLDGWAGFFACLERALYILVKQACLLELQRGLRKPNHWQQPYK